MEKYAPARVCCRVCERQSNLTNISIKDNKSFVKQYLACANVTFEINDGLPSYLCRLCITQLTQSYQFKQKCEKTFRKLKDFLKTSMILPNTNLEITKIEVNDLVNNSYDEDDDDDNFQQINDIIFTDAIENIDLQQSSKNVWAKHRPKKFNKSHICDICNASYYFKIRLESHMQQKHNMAENLQQCLMCPKWFTRKKLTKHLTSEHGHKAYKCEFCSFRFTCYKNLKRHESIVHDNKLFTCDICQKTFTQKVNLQSHMSYIHINEWNYSCNICGKPFKVKGHLMKHVNLHLPLHEQKQNQSSTNKPATFVNKIKKSTNSHLKKSQFVCDHCGKICPHIHALQNHLLVHTDERPFHCHLCDRKFKINSSLRLHLNSVHHRKRPFKCDQCDMSFAQCTHLKTHLRVHTGEKPFKCEFCGKEFSLKAICMTHRRLHTGEKPYKCKECDECFIDLNGLKRHRKKMHEKSFS